MSYHGDNYSPEGLGERGYPVMVALHGCYADVGYFATDFMNFQRAGAVGNEGIVVYGIANNPQSSCGWQVGSDDELDYLDSVIAKVAEQYCIDESRVLMLGYSWGSYQAHHYACSRPGKIKAVIGGAGGYPNTYNTDPRVCGQIPTLIYGRTHDNDEYISKSYNARDKKLETNECQNNPSAAAAPFANNPNPNVVGCVDYPGCVDGLRMTFCEDPEQLFDKVKYGQGSEPGWNHTIWHHYHRSLWQWFTGLP